MIWWSKQPTEAKQQALQQKINWKYPERAVLKSWAIEVRDYDTMPANWLFVIGISFVSSLLMLFNWLITDVNETLPITAIRVSMLLLGFVAFAWLVYSVAFSKKFLVYRFTNQGFEIAGWDRQAENQQKIFIGVGIACSVVALFIVALVPQAFFLLFIGPGGIILVVLSQTTNKQAWEQQKGYSQKDFDWDLFTEILLYKQRDILTLFFDVEERNKRLGRRSYMEKMNIFCYPSNYEDMIEFVKSKVKENIPCSEGRVELDPDECG